MGKDGSHVFAEEANEEQLDGCKEEHADDHWRHAERELAQKNSFSNR